MTSPQPPMTQAALVAAISKRSGIHEYTVKLVLDCMAEVATYDPHGDLELIVQLPPESPVLSRADQEELRTMEGKGNG